MAHTNERSGAPRVTLDLARRFQQAGREVLFCVPAPGGIGDDARAAGITTLQVDNPPGAWTHARGGKLGLALKRISAILHVRRIIRERGVGLVWCGSTMAVFAGLGAKLARIPIVYHIHEDLILTRGNRVRVLLVRATASAVVFVARRSRHAFPRLCVPATMLPNAVDLARIEAAAGSRDRMRASLALTPKQVALLTVAFLTQRKGIDVLLRAFAAVHARHPHAVLLIAGNAPPNHEDYAAEMRALAERLGIASAVRFMGHREDVPELLAACDVFVLASRNEALPLTILEAMAARRPVVATRVGSVEDLARDGQEGLLVPSEDDAALASALSRLIDEPATAERLAAQGQERARQHFGVERFARRALRIADWAMARGRR